MTRFGVLGATALSLSLALATPVLAQQAPHVRAGGHAAMGNAAMGNMGRASMGAGPRVQSNFGAQANAGRANVAAGGNGQFARRGEFRGGRDRGFGRGAGFAAGAAAVGIATGAAIAANDYGYGSGYYGDNYAYDPGYYGDSYAYDTGVTFDAGLPLVAFDQPVPVEGPVVASASYCEQRYRSYDPASGTYLGFDGLRHPCP